jgi:hypothetical protein
MSFFILLHALFLPQRPLREHRLWTLGEEKKDISINLIRKVGEGRDAQMDDRWADVAYCTSYRKKKSASPESAGIGSLQAPSQSPSSLLLPSATKQPLSPFYDIHKIFFIFSFLFPFLSFPG